MKYVQTHIEDKDFLRLKYFCWITHTSVQELLRRLILDFVQSDTVSEVENYIQELNKLGANALENLKTEQVQKKLLRALLKNADGVE